jgi:hypothetical protein
MAWCITSPAGGYTSKKPKKDLTEKKVECHYSVKKDIRGRILLASVQSAKVATAAPKFESLFLASGPVSGSGSGIPTRLRGPSAYPG